MASTATASGQTGSSEGLQLISASVPANFRDRVKNDETLSLRIIGHCRVAKKGRLTRSLTYSDRYESLSNGGIW